MGSHCCFDGATHAQLFRPVPVERATSDIGLAPGGCGWNVATDQVLGEIPSEDYPVFGVLAVIMVLLLLPGTRQFFADRFS